jgi:hypothetical protein
LPRLCGAFFLSHGSFVGKPGAFPTSAGAARAVAWRIWQGRAPAPGTLRQRAAHLAQTVPQIPGRVHEMGRFRDDDGQRALAACLPQALAEALRPKLEWYGCRGAGFHTDAHYQDVLFGAWCLAGPARDIVFAGGGMRLACEADTVVVFDPFLPHAVLDPGQLRYERGHYAGAAASVFVGFELELTAPARAAFGIGAAQPGAFVVGSATAVNAETGAFVR